MEAKPKSSGVNVCHCFEPSFVFSSCSNIPKAVDTITLERRNVLLALIAAGFPIVGFPLLQGRHILNTIIGL